MSQIFTRPERPAELSRHDIITEIKKGRPVFCGHCHKRIEIKNYILKTCPCQSVKINSAGVFRIAQDNIFYDVIVIDDTAFNPHIHIPTKRHKRRSRIYHSAGYGDD